MGLQGFARMRTGQRGLNFIGRAQDSIYFPGAPALQMPKKRFAFPCGEMMLEDDCQHFFLG